MPRFSKITVLTVLFFFMFSLAGPVGVAWADHDSGDDAVYYDDDDRASDDCQSDDEDCDEGMSTGEIIGAVIGSVVGVVAGIPLGWVGGVGLGAAGFFLGKWIGSRFGDDDDDDSRASDDYDDDDGRWRNRWDDHKDWWKERWYDWEDRWDSDRFPGKYWWKDRWNDTKFWEDDDDGANAPTSSDLGVLRAAFHAATSAYQDALEGDDQDAKKAARKAFESARNAYFRAKAAAGN